VGVGFLAKNMESCNQLIYRRESKKKNHCSMVFCFEMGAISPGPLTGAQALYCEFLTRDKDVEQRFYMSNLLLDAA
jgi:hypothetical protein